ncbi:vomeronasal type-2 receptor 26 [Tupaia chinensis]|uniref:vomeronasal type-2 receptor 26 n=1 Tax=Tupaia chinensis TaxID=246437 RepID=UPI0007042696|nr:vomeronasal type-2 receptor 26 [Tupaia chinensis]
MREGSQPLRPAATGTLVSGNAASLNRYPEEVGTAAILSKSPRNKPEVQSSTGTKNTAAQFWKPYGKAFICIQNLLQFVGSMHNPDWLQDWQRITENLQTECELIRESCNKYPKRSVYRDGDLVLSFFFPLYDFRDEESTHQQPFLMEPSKTLTREYYWENYHFVLAFLFAIEEINKSPYLLPNISLGFDIYNAFPDHQRTLESALLLLSGVNQTLPNYNCEAQQKFVAIIAGNIPVFSAQIGTLLELYKIPQVTYGPFDSTLSDKSQFASVYQMATNDSSLAQGIISLLMHFGWTWVALYVSDDMKEEQFLQVLNAEMIKRHICVAFTEMLPSGTGVKTFHNINYGHRIRVSSANVYIIIGEKNNVWNLAILEEFDLIWGKLHPFMKKSQFTNSTGYNLSLDDINLAQYDIHNLVRLSEKNSTSWLLVKVGDFVYKSPHDQGLVINKMLIKWPASLNETPESVCSQSCGPGFQKTVLERRPNCCFLCVFCTDRAISNQTDAEQCIKCPTQEYPNSERTHCLPKSETFLAFGDSVGMSMAFMTLCFSVVTALVLVVFVKHRHTPIVKANNQALSFTLLISLILCFLCPLLFIGHPNTATCILQQVTFGPVFTVAVSTVLAKTLTVILAFKAMKPGRTMRCLLLSGASNTAIPICSLIQVIICAVWLGTSPPFIEIDSHSEPRHIIIMCNKGSITAFYCVLGYLGFLALGTFTVAFLARNLPGTFNEAKFLTFSMLVFCSVWVTFLPVYHSTKGKFWNLDQKLNVSLSQVSAAFQSFDVIFPKLSQIFLSPVRSYSILGNNLNLNSDLKFPQNLSGTSLGPKLQEKHELAESQNSQVFHVFSLRKEKCRELGYLMSSMNKLALYSCIYYPSR